ncbi:hypothetical protein GW943_03055 [Candidatus Parcubacteria bacterium]|nr:hypothetical protein [Candidatus Parcubacteria bacterium]
MTEHSERNLFSRPEDTVTLHMRVQFPLSVELNELYVYEATIPSPPPIMEMLIR